MREQLLWAASTQVAVDFTSRREKKPTMRLRAWRRNCKIVKKYCGRTEIIPVFSLMKGILIWGVLLVNATIRSTVKSGTASIMVWRCFSNRGVGPSQLSKGIIGRFSVQIPQSPDLSCAAEEECENSDPTKNITQLAYRIRSCRNTV